MGTESRTGEEKGMNIPKLIILNPKNVRCPKCSFISFRYTKPDNRDELGKECPYCRLRSRLKEVDG